MKQDEVKLGIIGAGGIGHHHYRYLRRNEIKRCRLTALCDINPAALDTFDDSLDKYTSPTAFLKKSGVDAVIIGTPHYAHTTVGIAALKAGLHVLVEKPISVHKADCQRLIAAHTSRKQVFSAMFNQRTTPLYRKIKELLDRKELGRVMRINWIITTWFRTQNYYDNGDWRATWSGEGGGVLLNQCPHQLDLFQWFFGMPASVRGFCDIGKWHNIEVEDDVTAFMRFENGATGVFVTSTGDAPGTNRLEITGESGKLIAEDGKLTFTRNEVSARDFCKTSPTRFGRPDIWNVDIPVPTSPGGHAVITQNFVNAILEGEPLIAPAREGIHSVELGNAMLLSSLTDKTVTLPMDEKAFERRLKKLIRESTFVKKTKASRTPDNEMASSFGTKG